MKTVLILHGIQGHAGIHWQQWLHDKLVSQGYKVLMPELPAADRPDRETWLKTIQDTLAKVNQQELIIVAHSLGVPSALDYIETLDKPVKALISVSGFAQDYGAELNSYFMSEKQIDFNQIKANLEQAYVLYGDNDPYVPQPTLESLAQNLEVEAQVFEKGGHLNTDTGYKRFPYLLEIIEEID
jgi:hypothetical protein